MSKVKSIGLIVEDNSDFDCLTILIKRISNQDRLSFKKVIGNGCGKIKKKALAWSKNLNIRGCNVLILVHDLDRNNLKKLKAELENAIKGNPIKSTLICIPIEELEAWLLSDPKGLKQTFNLKRIPKVKGLPETIPSPKEKLRDLVNSCSNKNISYMTKYNKKIATNISLELIEKKCPSYRELSSFINKLTF